MNSLPKTKPEAFEHGALTRANGFCEYFNPFRGIDNDILYSEWLKGWSLQDEIMKE